MKKAQEKRAHPRLSVYHLAKYRVISRPDQEEKVVTSVKDISGGGICLLSDEDLPLEAILQVHIRFPGVEQAIPCLVKVCWKRYLKGIKKYRVGAQFVEIEDILRNEIVGRIESVRKTLGAEKDQPDKTQETS